MFEDLQQLFRKTWDAFRAEAGKREPEDEVAELLTSMRRELVAARAVLPTLSEEVRRTRADLAREREALEQTERRGTMASRIGDEETVRVAAEFAARHRERTTVLEQRLAAAESELSLRNREADEMKRRYQEADTNRFVLVAQLRQAHARERARSALDQGVDPFSEWQRVEETIDDTAAYVDALEELDPTGHAPAPPPAADVEDRLRELKRRLDRERGA